MATSRSRNAKHSDRDLDIALRRKRKVPFGSTVEEIVSPPELTVPGTQARHFEIVVIEWDALEIMSKRFTEHVNRLAKKSKAVVTVCGQSCDPDRGILYTIEWWTY